MSEFDEQKGLGMIVASALNGVIGAKGAIPWHQPADLAYFKAKTLNKAILMGRKTWESLGRPLPKRRNIVLTRDPDYVAKGAEVFGDLDAALESLKDQAGVIIGGAEIYRLALPKVETLWWTRVLANVDGDAILPQIDMTKFELIEKQKQAADEKNLLAMEFQLFYRKP